MIRKITKLKILFLTCVCLICSCQNSKDSQLPASSQKIPASSNEKTPVPESSEKIRKYDTASIVAELIKKAKRFDSYAHDYVFQGHAVKRMSFLFKKNGKDFYSYRSDYFENGKKFSRLFGVDAKYNYEYSPIDKIAFRRPSQMQWNETNYAGAKDWHFNFDGYEVVGEKLVNGKDCYIMESKNSVITVWKENGMKTSLSSKGDNRPPLEYDNFAFNLSEDEFTIPEGTEIKE